MPNRRSATQTATTVEIEPEPVKKPFNWNKLSVFMHGAFVLALVGSTIYDATRKQD